MKGLEPLIFEISKPGRKAYSLPELDVPVKSVDSLLPEQHLRKDLLNFLRFLK